MKSLNAEYAELLSAKKKAFTEYTNARTEMREVMTVKANVELFLNRDMESQKAKHNLLYFS